jgi:hypothetical protein
MAEISDETSHAECFAFGILDQRVVPMMYFRPNIEMRPCEKVYVRQRVAHVTCGRCGFPHTSSHTSHGCPGSQRHAQTAGSSDPRTGDIVGGRVGNVACEDQVRLCHLRAGSKRKPGNISVQVGQYVEGRHLHWGEPLVVAVRRVLVKAHLGRKDCEAHGGECDIMKPSKGLE